MGVEGNVLGAAAKAEAGDEEDMGVAAERRERVSASRKRELVETAAEREGTEVGSQASVLTLLTSRVWLDSETVSQA